MTVLQKLLGAWTAEDYQATAACFSPGAQTKFIDYCPALVGQEPIYLYGDRTIEMYFRNAFYPMNRTFYIAEVKELGENEANCFACYRGRYVFAHLYIEATDENGCITRAVVRPE